MNFLKQLRVANSCELKLVKSNCKIKIAIYLGSFDPFHDGHLEVVNVISNYCDVLLIVPAIKNNRKPLLSNLNHRIHIILNSIKSVDKKIPILIVKDNLEEIYKAPKKYIHIISVFGFDVYRDFMKNRIGNDKFIDQWFVVPRGNALINKALHNVTFLDTSLFNKQKIASSTNIRKYFYHKNTIDDAEDINSLYISKNIAEYIIKHNMYHKKTILENDIKRIVKEQFKFDCKLKESNGKSGNNVYLITGPKYLSGFCYVKVFSDKSKMNHEINGYKFLKNNGFNSLKILFCESQKDNLYHLLFLEKSPGKLYEKFIFDNANNTKILYDSAIAIGKNVRKIHEIEKIDPLKIFDKDKLKKMAFFKYKKYNEKLLNNYIDNIGNFTYVHGDLNTVNLFVTDNLELFMIDVGKLSELVDEKHQKPIGVPANDCNRFIESVRYFINTSHLGNSVFDTIKNGFDIGYGNKYEIITKESDEAFSDYWKTVFSKHF